MQSIKSKHFSILQSKRRKEQLERDRQRRDSQLAYAYIKCIIQRKRREQLLFMEDGGTMEPISIPDSENGVRGRKPEAVKDWKRRREFSATLCVPEWMVEIPSNLEVDWLLIPRPEGKRFILTSKRGKTTLRSINGYAKHVKSNLPGSILNFRGNCVLDVILSDDAVYVMDVLFFNNVDYSESEAESRMFTVSSRLSEDDYVLLLPNQQLPIKPVPWQLCSLSWLQQLYEGNVPYRLNGLLFVERCSRLREGSSPMQLLWKDARTATYFIDTDAEGRVREVQEVTLLYKDHTLRSLEGLGVLEAAIPSVEDDSLVRCLVRSVSFNPESQTWELGGVEVKGYASLSKTLPDTMSKIVFQQMARYQPLTVEEIVGRMGLGWFVCCESCDGWVAASGYAPLLSSNSS